MLLLAVARDGASRSGLLCPVVMFMCVVIGCVQGRRQSLWTVCAVLMFMCVVIGCVQGRRQSLWTGVFIVDVYQERRQSLWTGVFIVDVYVCCYWLWPGTAPVAVDCCVQW